LYGKNYQFNFIDDIDDNSVNDWYLYHKTNAGAGAPYCVGSGQVLYVCS